MHICVFCLTLEFREGKKRRISLSAGQVSSHLRCERCRIEYMNKQARHVFSLYRLGRMLKDELEVERCQHDFRSEQKRLIQNTSLYNPDQKCAFLHSKSVSKVYEELIKRATLTEPRSDQMTAPVAGKQQATAQRGKRRHGVLKDTASARALTLPIAQDLYCIGPILPSIRHDYTSRSKITWLLINNPIRYS